MAVHKEEGTVEREYSQHSKEYMLNNNLECQPEMDAVWDIPMLTEVCKASIAHRAAFTHVLELDIFTLISFKLEKMVCTFRVAKAVLRGSKFPHSRT